MQNVIDKPQIDDLQIDGFADTLYVVSLGEGKYLAVNATTVGPDPMQFNALCVFEKPMDVAISLDVFNMKGEQQLKTLEECVEIVKSKDNLQGLALQELGKTKLVHWLK